MNKSLEAIRIGIILGVLVVAILLVRAWDTAQTLVVPQILHTNQQNIELSQSAEYFILENNLLRVLINKQGGDIVESTFKTIKQELQGSHPYQLLQKQPLYIAQLGIVGLDSNSARISFNATQSQSNSIILRGKKDGIEVIKTLSLAEDSYYIKHRIQVKNTTKSTKQVSTFAQILRDDTPPPASDGFGIQPFFGAAFTTPDNHYEKYDLEDISDGDIVQTASKGWIAFSQHYFATAWVSEQSIDYYLRKVAPKKFVMGLRTKEVDVAPGTTLSQNLGLYIGPKIKERLTTVAPHFDLLTDYSWLWWLAQPLLWVLKYIENLVHNWGAAIILLTLVIKIIFYRLSERSYRSMAKMKRVQPELIALKERYKDEPSQLNQKMMQLYRDKKINPLGGCLPILVQMPVFLALYWVLLESVELRHAPFFGWIEDLSKKDPLFILPILMGISMAVQQKFNPAPLDPTQAKIMKMLPLLFTFLFLWFPSGLVLYWVSNNTLTILQQQLINYRLNQSGD